MLDLTKKLQTRDGRNVLIKFMDGRSETHPIVGYIEDETSFSFWTLAGIWAGHASPENDLINTPEWRLPDPPHGYEWHRVDGWTEEMLPEGWRPQYVGESGISYETSSDGIKWEVIEDGLALKMPTPKFKHVFFRTNAPLPPPKPKPQEVQLCADDIKAGDEFLIAGYRYAWCSITDNYVSYAKIGIYSFKELMEYGHKIRSIGETEWRKCSKQEEVPA